MSSLEIKYSFIKRLDWRKYLNEDELSIADKFGIDGLLWLIDHFKGMPVYFTEARIEEMKKDYLRKNPDNLTPRELARKLDYALMTVYRHIGKPETDPGLFE